MVITKPNINAVKKSVVALVCLLAVAAGLRGMALGEPYLANFSSYQLDSASISRFFLREHFSDLLRPKLDFVVDGQPGVLLHYYPVCSLVAAAGSALLGGPMEVWGRVQAMAFSLGTIFLIFLLGKKIKDALFGLIAAAVYAISPISVIYGQTFMNEAAGVFFVVLALTAFWMFRASGCRVWLLCGVVSAGVALVTRVNGFYLFLPMLLLWVDRQEGFFVKRVGTWLIACVCVGILPFLWYGYTYVQAQGNSHVYNCMFPQLGRQAPGVALNAQFWKTLLRTIGTLDFTPLGLILLFAGWTREWRARERRWVLAWFVAVLASFLMMPQKIVDHPFYTLHLIPPAAFLIAGGLQATHARLGRWGTLGIVLVVCLWSFRYFYHPVARTVLPENRGVMAAARVVQQVVPLDQKIIAARGPANCLLHYSDRRGWAFTVEPMREVPYQDLFRWRFLSAQEVEQRSAAYVDPVQWLEFLRSQGAAYFVAAGPEEIDQNPPFKEYLTSHYSKISARSEPWQIFDLRQKTGT